MYFFHGGFGNTSHWFGGSLEVACYRIQLKPESVPTVREWSARLRSEIAEVRKLLKAEGVVLESAFLEQGPQGDFLVYYVRSLDLKRTHEVSQASQHPIDVYHRDVMKRITASVVELECLLDAEGNS